MAVRTHLYQNFPISEYMGHDEELQKMLRETRYEPTPIPDAWYEDIREMERESELESLRYERSRPRNPVVVDRDRGNQFWIVVVVVFIFCLAAL